MIARGNVVFGSAADVVLVRLGDNVEFGMHASQIVPGVARQFVASYGRVMVVQPVVAGAMPSWSSAPQVRATSP